MNRSTLRIAALMPVFGLTTLLLVSVCQAEQQRLAHELVQLNQSQQGAKVYQLFG